MPRRRRRASEHDQRAVEQDSSEDAVAHTRLMRARPNFKKCRQCRISHLPCKPTSRAWPGERCQRCRMRGEPCSAPMTKAEMTKQNVATTTSEDAAPAIEATESLHSLEGLALTNYDEVPIDMHQQRGLASPSGAPATGHHSDIRSPSFPNSRSLTGESSPKTVLVDAVILGNLAQVQRLLDDGANPDCESDDGTFPLLAAAEHDHILICKILLDYGASTNKQWRTDRRTALHEAVFSGSLLICNALIRAGANPNLICIEDEQESTSPLHLAVLRKNRNILSALLSLKESGRLKEKTISMSLISAVALGDFDTVRLFASYKCDLGLSESVKKQIESQFFTDKECLETTPLITAAKYGFSPILLLLLNCGVSYEERDPYSRANPLLAAAASGHLEVVKILLSHGADPDSSDRWGRKALHLATTSGHISVADLLISKNVSLDEADHLHGLTPFDVALSKGFFGIARKLRLAGCANSPSVLWAEALMLHKDKFQSNGDGLALLQDACPILLTTRPVREIMSELNTSLTSTTFQAARYGCVQVFDYCAEHSEVPLYSEIDDVESPLTIASSYGWRSIVDRLISRGAFTGPGRYDRSMALHGAAVNDHQDVVELILSQGRADTDYQHEAAIMVYVIERKQWATAKAFCCGEVCNKAVAYRPLHAAAAAGHTQLLDLIIGTGTSLESTDAHNWTPLAYACQRGTADAVRLLINAGAQSSVMVGLPEDEDEISLLHVAVQRADMSIIIALMTPALCAKGDLDNQTLSVDVASKLGHTPLAWACKQGSIEVAELLLSLGANVNAINSHKRRALHIAAVYGHVDLCNLLRKGGAEIDAADDLKITALMEAALNDEAAVVRLLLRWRAKDSLRDHLGRIARDLTKDPAVLKELYLGGNSAFLSY